MDAPSLTIEECAERGHAPNPIHIGGPGPLVSDCRCGKFEWMPIRKQPRFDRTTPGCCSACGGTGTDIASPETNGRCWDCYGTGHTHQPETSCG